MCNAITRGGRPNGSRRGRRHADPEQPDGGDLRFTVQLAGQVRRRSATGTLQATVTGTGTDAAGATTLSCGSGGVTWKTATG
jgi:hypothetical protein